MLQFPFGAGLGLAAVLIGMSLEGGQATSLLRVTAIMIVIGGTVGALAMTYHWDEFKMAIKVGLTHQLFENSDAKIAKQFFLDASKTVLWMGALGFIIGLIHVVDYVAIPEVIGKGLAMALIAPFLAIVIKIFVTDRCLAGVELAIVEKTKLTHPGTKPLSKRAA